MEVSIRKATVVVPTIIISRVACVHPTRSESLFTLQNCLAADREANARSLTAQRVQELFCENGRLEEQASRLRTDLLELRGRVGRLMEEKVKLETPAAQREEALQEAANTVALLESANGELEARLENLRARAQQDGRSSAARMAKLEEEELALLRAHGQGQPQLPAGTPRVDEAGAVTVSPGSPPEVRAGPAAPPQARAGADDLDVLSAGGKSVLSQLEDVAHERPDLDDGCPHLALAMVNHGSCMRARPSTAMRNLTSPPTQRFS